MVEFINRLDFKFYEVVVFTDPRHLEEMASREKLTLQACLEKARIPYFCAPDINSDPHLESYIDKQTLGIGMGEVWKFSKKIIELFEGKLVDLMAIPLPQFRGGAHYSWQILSQSFKGGSHIQIINEAMRPGCFDSGGIIKAYYYRFPTEARTPQDYFDYAGKIDLEFLLEFSQEIRDDIDFTMMSIREDISSYFPRLNTQLQGFINWGWKVGDLDRFICAFGRPYAGASTFCNAQRYYLRESQVIYDEGLFHPFQAGLIYKKIDHELYIAANGGTLIIREVLDESGNPADKELGIGMRFYTPAERLENAMLLVAEYDRYENTKV